MRIKIADDNQNWLNWGNLVLSWINGAQRPITVGELKQQLSGANVTAEVEGIDRRTVTILDYEDDPTAALVLAIPTKKMLAEKLKYVKAGPYPRELMPTFYDIAYGGAARASLSLNEAKDFAVRRIGEYTVNECC